MALLKVAGAAVALLAVSRTPRLLSPRVLGTMLWAAFATLAGYVAGSIVQAVVLLTGVAGDAEQVDAAAVGYVLAFLLGAAGFGVLATSYARRAGLSVRVMLIGICGAPVVPGGVLFVLPAILRATGLLSGSWSPPVAATDPHLAATAESGVRAPGGVPEVQGSRTRCHLGRRRRPESTADRRQEMPWRLATVRTAVSEGRHGTYAHGSIRVRRAGRATSRDWRIPSAESGLRRCWS